MEDWRFHEFSCESLLLKLETHKTDLETTGPTHVKEKHNKPRQKETLPRKRQYKVKVSAVSVQQNYPKEHRFLWLSLEETQGCQDMPTFLCGLQTGTQGSLLVPTEVNSS